MRKTAKRAVSRDLWDADDAEFNGTARATDEQKALARFNVEIAGARASKAAALFEEACLQRGRDSRAYDGAERDVEELEEKRVTSGPEMEDALQRRYESDKGFVASCERFKQSVHLTNEANAAAVGARAHARMLTQQGEES